MIVGLSGKMGAGKNEAAKRLALLSSLPVVEVSFAAKLKQSAAALLDHPTPILESWKNDRDVVVTVSRKEWGRTTIVSEQSVRSFLQRYGTESHRDVFGPDFWLDAALPLADDVRPGRGPYGDALYVVTDVRFPNEQQRVRDLGGITVRIVGPDEQTGSHPSEQVLECDYEIDNTVRDDGYAALDMALAELLAKIGVDTPARDRLPAP